MMWCCGYICGAMCSICARMKECVSTQNLMGLKSGIREQSELTRRRRKLDCSRSIRLHAHMKLAVWMHCVEHDIAYLYRSNVAYFVLKNSICNVALIQIASYKPSGSAFCSVPAYCICQHKSIHWLVHQ